MWQRVLVIMLPPELEGKDDVRRRCLPLEISFCVSVTRLLLLTARCKQLRKTRASRNCDSVRLSSDKEQSYRTYILNMGLLKKCVTI
jgi:hypothetical protein